MTSLPPDSNGLDADDRALRDALVPTPPRRTDAAFSRSVAAKVAARRRSPLWFGGLSLTAAAAGALLFVVMGQPVVDGMPTDGGQLAPTWTLDTAVAADAMAQDTLGFQTSDALSDVVLLALSTAELDAPNLGSASDFATSLQAGNVVDDTADEIYDEDDAESDDELFEMMLTEAFEQDSLPAPIEVSGFDDDVLLALADVLPQ